VCAPDEYRWPAILQPAAPPHYDDSPSLLMNESIVIGAIRLRVESSTLVDCHAPSALHLSSVRGDLLRACRTHGYDEHGGSSRDTMTVAVGIAIVPTVGVVGVAGTLSLRPQVLT
jgi:hypothetical protein